MNALAASAGVVVDRLFGEPPTRWHPVAWFGSTMNAIEARWWADDRRRGAGYTAVGLAAGVVPAFVLRRAIGPSAATVLASGVAIAGAMLEREALGVAEALRTDDVNAARRLVGRLVGRSTDSLDAPEIARAVIETVAENTVDAVTASLFWASVGGAPGVLAHRAINTMDAMVGHRNPRHQQFGWASARLDDAANWLPARLTAVAVAVAAPSRCGEIARTVRRDAGRHPSPNGGVIEAAFAASLDIRLGGANVYGGIADDRGVLGDGRPARAADVGRATALARRATGVFAVGCVVTHTTARRLGRRASARR